MKMFVANELKTIHLKWNCSITNICMCREWILSPFVTIYIFDILFILHDIWSVTVPVALFSISIGMLFM
jgi:hypothetical protein